MKPTYCFFDSVTSTNSHIVTLPTESQQHGLCISVGYQTQGRGQASNVWLSEPNENLLFSMVLRPTRIHPSNQFLLSQLVSLAIVNTIAPIIKDVVTIKWPNDIYINDQKLAGILIENSIVGDELAKSIVGVGLNVNQTEFNAQLPNPISLKSVTKNEINRLNLLETLADNILNSYEEWDSEMNEEIHDQYMEHLYRNRGFHTFRLPNNKTFKARIDDVKPNGEIVLERWDGSKTAYYFKEVAFELAPKFKLNR